MRKAKFDRRGPLALAAVALGVEFVVEELERPDFEDCSGVAVVTVAGPLCHAPDADFDDYQSIARRVSAAFASSCASVVLRIDSPGGSTFGCVETARALRLMATSARKPLLAFIEGYGASAAYALACGASAIYALPSALVGSIGVIEGRADVVEANRRSGLNVVMVTSGARKGDTHANVPITDAALAAAQAQVDELAGHFFDLVAEARGASREAVAGLEAGLFVATQETPGVALIDGTTTFEALIAMVASGGITTARAIATSAEDTMDELKKMLAALATMAEGDGEEADKAKKMLAALEGGEDDKKDPEPAAEEGGEDDKKDPEPAAEETDKKDPPAAKASAAPSSAVDVRLAKLELAEVSRARSALLATRPDLMADAKTRAWLSKAPLATVRNAVTTFPKIPTVTTPNLAASASVQATRGEGQGVAAASAQPSDLDVRMGLAKPASVIRRERTAVIFGALPASDARAIVAQKAGAK